MFEIKKTQHCLRTKLVITYERSLNITQYRYQQNKEFHPKESSISGKKGRLTVLLLSISNIFSSSKCPITSFLIFSDTSLFL